MSDRYTDPSDYAGDGDLVKMGLGFLMLMGIVVAAEWYASLMARLAGRFAKEAKSIQLVYCALTVGPFAAALIAIVVYLKLAQFIFFLVCFLWFVLPEIIKQDPGSKPIERSDKWRKH